MKINVISKYSTYLCFIFFSIAAPLNALKIVLMLIDFQTIDKKELAVGCAVLALMLMGIYVTWSKIQQMRKP